MVGSCCSCKNCSNNLENYCPKLLLTYGATYYDGPPTYGGYSDIMVVNEHYSVLIPDNMALDASITVYSPLRHFELGKLGLHVGVVGLGGLGPMAVKFAKAVGAKVTVISTSPNKKDEAANRLVAVLADSFFISLDPEQLQAAVGTMDGIIDTFPAPLLPLISLLKTEAKLVIIGTATKPLELPVLPLLMGRKMAARSGIGGMKETQEMIDFSSKHDIKPDIEVIPMDYVNTAMERLHKADVRYRLVIDIGNTLRPT